MFLWAGGKRSNIIFKNPNQCDLTTEEAAPYDEVWFVDLCPSQMKDPAGGKPFHVFDHHASNVKRFGDDVNCTFSMKRSGTSLLGEMTGVYDPEWLDLKIVDYDDPNHHKILRAKLVFAFEAYDLGRFDHENGMYLADLAASFTQDEMLDVVQQHGHEVFNITSYHSRVEALASLRKIYADSAVKNILIKDFEGLKVGVVSSPVFWKNEVAERILNHEIGFDLAVVIDMVGGMVSLRSRPGGPDCSVIAGRYGGGGHPCAAGFKVNQTMLTSVLFEEALG
jgi:oligoribonuclease NrnB/cAMP/cGMP phosphodiesterase (DHH superfamily)